MLKYFISVEPGCLSTKISLQYLLMTHSHKRYLHIYLEKLARQRSSLWMPILYYQGREAQHPIYAVWSVQKKWSNAMLIAQSWEQMDRFRSLTGLWSIAISFVTLFTLTRQVIFIEGDRLHQDSCTLYHLGLYTGANLYTRRTEIRVGMMQLKKVEGRKCSLGR